MRISRRRLADASGRLADAWREPDVSDLLSLFAEYVDALSEFDIDHDLGIFDAGHAELVSLASSRGLLYKPCGAGGGDVGIVLSDDMERLEDFVSEASSHGYRPLDLEIDENGLKTDSKAA